jgi:hypothetical protein
MKPLKTYGVFVKVFVLGENEQEAVETLNEALDSSDLINQDGVLGFNPAENEDVDETEED